MTTPTYLIFHLQGCTSFGVELKTDNDASTVQYAIVKTPSQNTPPLEITTADGSSAQIANLSVTTEEINVALAASSQVDIQIWLSGALEAGDTAYVTPTFTGNGGTATAKLSIEAASPLALTSGLTTPIS